MFCHSRDFKALRPVWPGYSCWNWNTVDRLNQYFPLLHTHRHSWPAQWWSQYGKLSVHLNKLLDLISRQGEREGKASRRVTNVQTICAAMNSTPFAKTLCSEVNRLLLLYLTVPVRTSTTKRTFPVLRTVKTNLQSSMTQQKWNHLILLHSHKTMTDVIDLYQVASAFVRANYFSSMTKSIYHYVCLWYYACMQCGYTANAKDGKIFLHYFALLHIKHSCLPDINPNSLKLRK